MKTKKLKLLIFNYPGEPPIMRDGVKLLRFDDIGLRNLINLYKAAKRENQTNEYIRALIYCLANGYYQLNIYSDGSWEIVDSWIKHLANMIVHSLCNKGE